MLGSIDLDTYVEMNENLSTWNAELAVHLMETNEWDMFFMHSHPIDWMYHLVITDMISPDRKKSEKAWEVHRRIYECEDKMIGRILARAAQYLGGYCIGPWRPAGRPGFRSLCRPGARWIGLSV